MRLCWDCGRRLAHPNPMLLRELCSACVDRRVDDQILWPELRRAA